MVTGTHIIIDGYKSANGKGIYSLPTLHNKQRGHTSMSNSATNTVRLWTENNSTLNEYKDHLVEQAFSISELQEEIKDFITEECMPELTGIAGDFISHALAEVNWRELAEDYWSEKEEEDVEDVEDVDLEDMRIFWRNNS